MTAGNNGASTPEDDDPFGYLYADGQRQGATPPRQGGYGYPGPAAQPGVPRTSYNQVRTVGERQYGQVPSQHAYGQQGQQAQHGQQSQGYPHQPSAQYAAPETYPGGAPTRQTSAYGVSGHDDGGRGRGPNTRGLIAGAIAVVAVVLVGISVALITSGGDDEGNQADKSNAPAEQVKPSDEPEGKAGDKKSPPAKLPRQNAATLQLTPPATLGTDIKGAKGTNGAYVQFNGVGGAARWSVNVPADGTYTLFITYSVPGKDAKTSLTVNDEQPRSINMSNFAQAKEGDWEKGWTRTYSYVNLKKGSNTLKISCEQGDSCDALLDQVSLKQGEAKNPD
ncbi:carbohydrate-binding protein [Streptomyces sp. SCSIO 30461]|uniref:carbohydrate-binding protein n=1 Tax=Streptomyces sp. SCSIO 30461 TaxID=3118085 RepID=UPI0030D26EAB